MATGCSPPTPSWNGEFSPLSKRSSTVITDTTEPISMPCTTARSPRSAKKSMKTKMTMAMKKSTIQSWIGMTPTAPWTRSRRASSRVDVCSSHLS